MGRAQRAMDLIVLAEVATWVRVNDPDMHARQKAVTAARDVLCDEFNDVRLGWTQPSDGFRIETRPGSMLKDEAIVLLVAMCPGETAYSPIPVLTRR